MHVNINGQEFFFENTTQSIQQLSEQINATLSQTGLLYSHMVVNGVAVYDDPEAYIKENLKTLERIQVILVSSEQLLRDVLQTALDYVKRALPQLSRLVDEFYHVPAEDTWNALGQLVEGLQWFQQTETFIAGMGSSPEWANEVKELFRFSDVLTQLEEAVAQEDATMIADIIQYEVMQRFETMEKVLPDVVANEVDPSGSN
ncbi:hypothetical protein [Brevibacillus marinus]|uniref:hypothetical protein n=1 Tax=Brevibacillus marinus TaxID=2496837 RepID=UPI000F846EAA|nr:hypothetical protein [Brevibacillus marinus]